MYFRQHPNHDNKVKGNPDLALWESQQRHHYRKGQLDPDKKKLLDDIGVKVEKGIGKK